MAEAKETATKKIEDIREKERCVFWCERAVILILVLAFSGPRAFLCCIALCLLAGNFIFIALLVERQFIRRFFFEPDAIFYIERPAILLVILQYLVPGGSANRAIFGLVVLILTNCAMVYRYLEEQLPSEYSVSSETNTTQNAKETRRGDHDQGKKNEKAIIKEKSVMSQEVVGLFEAFMDGSFAPAMNFITKNHRWLLDYLPVWESLTGEEKKALWISFWESLNGEEKTSLINSSRRFESNSSNSMETKEEAVVEDEGLKEKSEVEADTRSSVDAISECDSVCITEEVGGRGEELKTEEDESPELQGNNTNISATKDAKTENVQEQSEDDLEEEEDETEGESDLESDNQSWEKLQNDLSDSEGIESSLDQQKTDEVEEAKDEQAATGNYTSDGGSSWEEVQNILGGNLGAEITPSDQKKAEPLEKAEHKEEDTSNYNSDESSWEEGQNNLSRTSSAPISSSEFFQEQMHEYERNTQEKKDLTQLWKQIEDEDVSVEDELKFNWGIEMWNLLAEECRKWNKEKEHLQANLDAVTESSEREPHKWEEENKELHGKLDVALQSCETYTTNQKAFAEERQKWNEERNALNAIITHTNENIQYGQTVVNSYYKHCLKLAKELNEMHSLYQDSFNKLIADRDGLSSRLEDATSSAERYKAWYIQSEAHCQYYKTCLEEYEGKYSKLMEDHLNLSSKLYSESSFAEHYKKLAQELEEKCSRLEEGNTDLTARVCAAKAASELYRSCLHDLVG